jgi:hypothetical protein
LDKHLYYAFGGFLIIIIALAFFIGRNSVPAKIEYVEKPVYVQSIKRDTVPIIYDRGITQITKQGRIDTLKLTDTVYNSKAYVSNLDTITNNDTLRVKYYFPQNNFELLAKPKPIVFKEITNTIYQTKVIELKREPYIDGLSHGGVAILTALITYGIMK